VSQGTALGGNSLCAQPEWAATAAKALFSAMAALAFASACRRFSIVSGLAGGRGLVGFLRTAFTGLLPANARSALRASDASPRGVIVLLALLDALSI
jgi:hypothetical protein